jgi:hypothetical protein
MPSIATSFTNQVLPTPSSSINQILTPSSPTNTCSKDSMIEKIVIGVLSGACGAVSACGCFCMCKCVRKRRNSKVSHFLFKNNKYYSFLGSYK